MLFFLFCINLGLCCVWTTLYSNLVLGEIVKPLFLKPVLKLKHRTNFFNILDIFDKPVSAVLALNVLDFGFGSTKADNIKFVFNAGTFNCRQKFGKNCIVYFYETNLIYLQALY